SLPRPLDDAALEPVRPPRRVRREHDLVRPERAQRILDRLDRVAVAHLAGRVEAGRSHRDEARRAPDAQVRSGEFSAGLTTNTTVLRAPERSRSSVSNSAPPTVSFATTRMRCSFGGLGAGAWRGRSSPRPRSNTQPTAAAVRTANTPTPTHLSIFHPMPISAK